MAQPPLPTGKLSVKNFHALDNESNNRVIRTTEPNYKYPIGLHTQYELNSSYWN